MEEALLRVLPGHGSALKLTETLCPHMLLSSRAHSEAQVGAPGVKGHGASFGRGSRDQQLGFLQGDAPQRDDRCFRKVESESREARKVVEHIQDNGETSASIGDHHADIVRKGSNASGVLGSAVKKGAKESANNQDKE